MGMAALGIGPGDEVFLADTNWIATAAPIVHLGAKPVFVDILPDSWCLDPEKVEAAITSRTKAIVAVHLYGNLCDMDRLLSIGARHGIHIIEDAAEAHGLQYQGRPCGSYGTLSTFSFYPNKLITTGEGGMIVTDDVALAQRCRSLRNLSFAPGRRFVHHELGWNYRMTNFQAALGRAQLSRAPELLEKRRAVGLRYLELFDGIDGLQLPLKYAHGSHNVFWVFGVVVDETTNHSAESVMRSLFDHGVGSRPFFYPLHQQPIVQSRGFGLHEDFPIASRIARQGLYLPLYADMSHDEMDRVASGLLNLFRRAG
jgi:perosamine synthetase